LRVFENRVLRRFVPKREKVTGGWKILQNEEVKDLYCSPDIISVIKLRRIRWMGHVPQMRKMKHAYKMLPEGRRPCGIPGCRWEDNNKQGVRVCSSFI